MTRPEAAAGVKLFISSSEIHCEVISEGEYPVTAYDFVVTDTSKVFGTTLEEPEALQGKAPALVPRRLTTLDETYEGE
ncbi:hypothetical protein N658DRAFT_510002 [Parathielavia hyrcaniae]|uniref:Uncharacterized protein n=1 Tax=Parathielavia hyrcaniae TaxID=113614 RepID=A0AAN6SYE4_9PEZI|nr:hypothetical protein N658DRAFT_510002 [Parathielavia hyrcaniae]